MFSRESAQDMWNHLVHVGIDNVANYVTSHDGLPTFIPVQVPTEDLNGVDPDLVFDVRSKTEHKARLVPGYSSSAVARPCGTSTRFPRKAQL